MSPPALNRKFSERSLRLAILMVLLYLILPVQALLPIDDPDISNIFASASRSCKTTRYHLSILIPLTVPVNLGSITVDFFPY